MVSITSLRSESYVPASLTDAASNTSFARLSTRPSRVANSNATRRLFDLSWETCRVTTSRLRQNFKTRKAQQTGSKGGPFLRILHRCVRCLSWPVSACSTSSGRRGPCRSHDRLLPFLHALSAYLPEFAPLLRTKSPKPSYCQWTSRAMVYVCEDNKTLPSYLDFLPTWLIVRGATAAAPLSASYLFLLAFLFRPYWPNKWAFRRTLLLHSQTTSLYVLFLTKAYAEQT